MEIDRYTVERKAKVAAARKASGGRTKWCNICRVQRVPMGIHACDVCD